MKSNLIAFYWMTWDGYEKSFCLRVYNRSVGQIEDMFKEYKARFLYEEDYSRTTWQDYLTENNVKFKEVKLPIDYCIRFKSKREMSQS